MSKKGLNKGDLFRVLVDEGKPLTSGIEGDKNEPFRIIEWEGKTFKLILRWYDE
jgi:hypothetical protein